MKNIQQICLISFLLFVQACGSRKEDLANTVKSDSHIQTQNGENVGSKVSGRKFIKTAELKFKVKDVLKTTVEIESMVDKMDGFVTSSNIQRQILDSKTIKISADSSLEKTNYESSNLLTFRVPTEKLDSCLKLINQKAIFVDYRKIEAEDASFDIIENQLTIKRNSQGFKNIPKNIKIIETINNLAENRDAGIVSNQRINDKIQFSTVSLIIYEGQKFYTEQFLTIEELSNFDTSFLLKIKESFLSGWKLLETLIAFIINIWGIILFAGLSYFAYKYFKNR